MKLKAKKSLGQNFLTNHNVVEKIIESANLSSEDVVIEIGPGTGVLTEKLAKICKKVVAIELDDRLVELLLSKLHKKDNVEIIHEDILKINLPDIIKCNLSQGADYKVIANLPYYITSPIIRIFLETKIPPSEMILMVQKEVAERIIAIKGEMSILAVSVQYYAKPELLFTVPRTAFNPQPEVDSAVIKISSISSSPLQGEEVPLSGTDEDIPSSVAMRHPLPVREEGCEKIKNKKFFQIVRAGFSAKRKTLVNNLSASLKLDKKEVEEKLESLGFSKNVRAQELGVEDWRKLEKLLKW